MDRKTFLKTVGALGCAGVAGVTLLGTSSCAGILYLNPVLEDRVLKVDKSQLKRSYAVLTHPGLAHPVYLARENEEWVAVEMLCTHKYCDLSAYGRVLNCSCHGSEFAPDGKVLKGPATVPLKKFRVESGPYQILVHVQ